MKKVFIFLFLVVTGYNQAQACTNETIDLITKEIDPYYGHQVSGHLEQSLQTLELCDQNLFYAGQKIGQRFDPYYENSTYQMGTVVQSSTGTLSSDLAQGLALGIVQKVNLYYSNSSVYMFRALLSLASSFPSFAKQVTLELLKKQDSYYAHANAQLLSTIQSLQQIARSGGGNNMPAGSIWAFRSQTQSCGFETGPWGHYALCPSYFASVADQYGNRIILSCKAPDAGIDFRVALNNELWSRLSGKTLNSLAFGTRGFQQSLGVPYLIQRQQTLLAEEVLAPEVLDALALGNQLDISIRLNSGEANLSLQFSLQGSNKAIKQLLSSCR